MYLDQGSVLKLPPYSAWVSKNCSECFVLASVDLQQGTKSMCVYRTIPISESRRESNLRTPSLVTLQRYNETQSSLAAVCDFTAFGCLDLIIVIFFIRSLLLQMLHAACYSGCCSDISSRQGHAWCCWCSNIGRHARLWTILDLLVISYAV